MQVLFVSLGALAMFVLPTRAVMGLRGRGRPDLAPAIRIAFASLAGTITVVALLVLDDWADSLLAAHMLQHVLIGDLVPLLLVLAVRGPVRARLLPVPLIRAARRLRLHRLLASITRPAPAFLFWAVSLGVWHVPAIYDRALADERLHALEHTSFMLGGLLVWNVLLEPARRGAPAGWRRFGYALALLATSGVLANTLILSYRPLYPAYMSQNSRPLALSPLRDQDLAGLVMMLEQLATLGLFAALAAREQLQLAPGGRPPGDRHPLAI